MSIDIYIVYVWCINELFFSQSRRCREISETPVCVCVCLIARVISARDLQR